VLPSVTAVAAVECAVVAVAAPAVEDGWSACAPELVAVCGLCLSELKTSLSLSKMGMLRRCWSKYMRFREIVMCNNEFASTTQCILPFTL
jgi:hypothetical protein